MLGQEKAQLEALTADQLSYGHSDGRVETKAQFIEGVMNRKAILKSLTLSDHTIAIVGTDAIARHTWTSESEMDGKLTTTKIGVLQVWQQQNAAWKLLARQRVRPPQAEASCRPPPAWVAPPGTGKRCPASPAGTALARPRFR